MSGSMSKSISRSKLRSRSISRRRRVPMYLVLVGFQEFQFERRNVIGPFIDISVPNPN